METNSPQSILNPHIKFRTRIDVIPSSSLSLFQRFHAWLYRLQTPIKRTTVDPERLRHELVSAHMSSELLRLSNTMGCESRVRWVSRRCRKLGLVFAGFVIDCPVQTVLQMRVSTSTQAKLAGLDFWTHCVAHEVYCVKWHFALVVTKRWKSC